MIEIDVAENHILDHCPPPRVVNLPLTESLGHALAERVLATSDVPPFDRAMMDGFAFRAEDVPGAPARLPVFGCFPAGSSPNAVLPPGMAAKIMTGAPLPVRADAVQKKELCREISPAEVEILEAVPPGRHVAPRGSELPRGTAVLEPGHLLGPAELGIMATFGLEHVSVYAKPTLALINTGSELVEVHEPIEGGKIRNSNQYSIMTYLRCHGYGCDARGIVPDDEGEIRSAIEELADRDVILLTGGVSVGDYALVQAVAREAGFDIFFDAVAIKPGKPLVFGRRGHTLLFGLSGNPVSSLVQSARFLLPALRQLAGWPRPRPTFITARLLEPIRHRPERTSYRPARVELRDGIMYCQPLPDKGSADLFAWRHANALTVQPADRPELAAGEPVQVLPLHPEGWVAV